MSATRFRVPVRPAAFWLLCSLLLLGITSVTLGECNDKCNEVYGIFTNKGGDKLCIQYKYQTCLLCEITGSCDDRGTPANYTCAKNVYKTQKQVSHDECFRVCTKDVPGISQYEATMEWSDPQTSTGGVWECQ